MTVRAALSDPSDGGDEIQMGKMTCRLVIQSDTPQRRAIKACGYVK